MVDIEAAKDAYPSDLSTGYKRAVAIARALAAQPQCVLYDEPTTMVDPIMSDHLGDLMLRLKRQLKLTSVVVTHDLDLMYKVADRVVFLYDGVIFFGPVSELEKSEHPHIQEFLAMDRVVRGKEKGFNAEAREAENARKSLRELSPAGHPRNSGSSVFIAANHDFEMDWFTAANKTWAPMNTAEHRFVGELLR